MISGACNIHREIDLIEPSIITLLSVTRHLKNKSQVLTQMAGNISYFLNASGVISHIYLSVARALTLSD